MPSQKSFVLRALFLFHLKPGQLVIFLHLLYVYIESIILCLVTKLHLISIFYFLQILWFVCVGPLVSHQAIIFIFCAKTTQLLYKKIYCPPLHYFMQMRLFFVLLLRAVSQETGMSGRRDPITCMITMYLVNA